MLKLCVLILFNSCVLQSAVSQYWRYAEWRLASTDLLSFNQPVILEYESIDNYRWENNDCSSLSDSNSSVIKLVCYLPGFHNILLSNGTDSFTIQVPLENSPHCYSWATTNTFNSSGTSLTIAVWVTSVTDITNNRALSRQYQLLGEHPTIHLLSHLTEYTITDEGYNTDSGYWIFIISVTDIERLLPYELVYDVNGRGVNILNCGIRSTQFIAHRPRYHIDDIVSGYDYDSNDQELTNATIQVYQDSLIRGLLVLIRDSVKIITQDGFNTYSYLQINDIDDDVMGIAFTSETICVLINGSIVIVASNDTTNTTGIPYGLDKITGRTKDYASGNQDIIVIWSSDSETNVIYLSTNKGGSFSDIQLQNNNFTRIQAVRIHPVQDELMILAFVNSTSAMFYGYDINSRSITERDYFLSGIDDLYFEYFPSYFADILIWGSQQIYYCTHRSTTLQEINILSQENNATFDYVFSSGERIQSVALGIVITVEPLYGTWSKCLAYLRGGSGQFALSTSTNALLYGSLATGSAYKILDSGEQITPFFDKLGNLKLINFNETITIVTVPIYSYILSKLYPPAACPFMEWSSNIRSNGVYFLDKNETILIWAAVVPRPWATNSISLALSEENLVTIEEQNQQTLVQGAIRRNMSIVVKPLSHSQNKSTVVLKVSPSTQNILCRKQIQQETNVHLTCPPYRHIKLQGKHFNCPEYQQYNYTISKDHYDPEFKGRSSHKASENKVVLYDMQSWGCPIGIQFNQLFIPVLELYDGDIFKHLVNVDFVVREIHGRTDYRYSATSNNARCNRTPQQWTGMLTRNGSQPFTAWTIENYENCFESNNEVSSIVPYEILNSTGVSSILWPSHGGIYVFVATVIGKDYTFCNLTVTFAVNVAAETTQSYLGYIVLGLTCILGAIGLVFSYISYRQLIVSGHVNKPN